jgi:hypothetical protein
MQENTLRYIGWPYKKETKAGKKLDPIETSQKKSVRSVVFDAKNYNKIDIIFRVIERFGTMGRFPVSHPAASRLYAHGLK